MISYLQAANITRRIGDLFLFEKLNLNINKEDKIAIVAVNGAGKTSLLDIISGKEKADEGTVNTKRGLRISYLEQNPVMNESNSIIDELFNNDSPLSQLIRDYEHSLISGDNALIQKMIGKMDDNKAWDYEVSVKQILFRLKLSDLNARISTLSGGQKKRVALAKVLVDDSDLLILDEPTNHLDLDMTEWLEEYLLNSSRSLLMVTHDRYFLDRVCNVILEISNKELLRYEGNYEYFLEKKAENESLSRANVEKARNIFRTELEWMRKMPKARRHKSKSRIESFYNIKDKSAGRAGEKSINIKVDVARMGKKILEIQKVSKSYGERKIIDNFSYVFNRFEKTGIVGRNGSGKTTLLNIITGNLKPDNGKLETGETIRFGYYRQEGMKFEEDMTVIDAAQKISETVSMGDGRTLPVSQFMNYFLFPPNKQQTLIRKLSGGEKRRLYLLTILMTSPNFLILDEPTNDLDIVTLNVLEEYLAEFKGCVVVVSHDRYFLDKVVDHIFEFRSDGTIKDFPGNYTQLRIVQEERAALADSLRSENEKIKISDSGKPPREKKQGLTFKEKKELESLEIEISQLESEKSAIESELNSGSLVAEILHVKSKRLNELIRLLDEKELRWLELSEK